ncbi:MAG TPA: ribosome recycling factor [Spirochaetia bacterium]|nr:ribosome recycling factor [Spirochaetales bacterium]HRS65714.1 ribosome recycling factor [Spirochaetia bacterium]HOT59435.1 ribosome recycling factor [Spirochaetales bacterium]HPD79538.1 ribosome recycling factor [Spirochaetales bacterium]HQK33875.1 ribosome recycling factor [Spirochaetales bacterium]
MEDIKKNCEERMKKTINALKDEFSSLRTGRASPALLDKIRVDYYGQKSPLNQVASVSVQDSRTIVIQPWDKALLPEIEKAIQKSELGINPSNDGKVIRIVVPPLTEERRKELVKNAKASAEQSRVGIRNIRRDSIEEIKKKKDSGLSEDALKKLEDELQKLTDNYISQINKILEEKEKEIMEV